MIGAPLARVLAGETPAAGANHVMFTVAQAARLYGIDLIDYERPSRGLLVSSGAGIMMGVMDEARTLRWCVDVDSLKPTARLDQFLVMAERLCDPVAICGWFSITDPRPLRAAIAGMTQPPICYGGNVRFGVGRESDTLRSFLDQLGCA